MAAILTRAHIFGSPTESKVYKVPITKNQRVKAIPARAAKPVSLRVQE